MGTIEKSRLEANSPLVFSTVNERSILRFLKLIACDNSKIGTYEVMIAAAASGFQLASECQSQDCYTRSPDNPALHRRLG
ncbi:MAG TPA: hypothetical protein VF845_13905 [Terriglobales bacterium]